MREALTCKVVRALITAGVVLGTLGCVAPPHAEKQAAEHAVSIARTAGAEKYAAGDFAAATNALREAEAQMGARKYKEAKTAYARVRELSDKAARAVESGKAAMKAEVEQQVADAEKRWQGLESKVKAAARALGADRKQAWETDAKAAREALQAARAAMGDEPVAAKESLGPVTSALDKWEVQLKGVAAPLPKK